MPGVGVGCDAAVGAPFADELVGSFPAEFVGSMTVLGEDYGGGGVLEVVD